MVAEATATPAPTVEEAKATPTATAAQIQIVAEGETPTSWEDKEYEVEEFQPPREDMPEVKGLTTKEAIGKLQSWCEGQEGGCIEVEAGDHVPKNAWFLAYVPMEFQEGLTFIKIFGDDWGIWRVTLENYTVPEDVKGMYIPPNSK